VAAGCGLPVGLDDVPGRCALQPAGGAALRENGCPWDAHTRDLAARTLGYRDDLGNLVDQPLELDTL